MEYGISHHLGHLLKLLNFPFFVAFLHLFCKPYKDYLLIVMVDRMGNIQIFRGAI